MKILKRGNLILSTAQSAVKCHKRKINLIVYSTWDILRTLVHISAWEKRIDQLILQVIITMGVYVLDTAPW